MLLQTQRTSSSSHSGRHVCAYFVVNLPECAQWPSMQNLAHIKARCNHHSGTEYHDRTNGSISRSSSHASFSQLQEVSRFTGLSPCTMAQIPTRQRILASQNLWKHEGLVTTHTRRAIMPYLSTHMVHYAITLTERVTLNDIAATAVVFVVCCARSAHGAPRPTAAGVPQSMRDFSILHRKSCHSKSWILMAENMHLPRNLQAHLHIYTGSNSSSSAQVSFSLDYVLCT